MDDGSDDSNGRGNSLAGGKLKRGEVPKGGHSLRDQWGIATDGRAANYVTYHGKRKGVEFLYGYDIASSKVIDTTYGGQNHVKLTEKLKEAMRDPKSKVVLHHNHTNNSSFSDIDIYVLADYPGVAQVVAHSVEDFTYRISALERGNINKHLADFRHEAQVWISNTQKQFYSTINDTDWLLSHVTCLLLQAAGFVEYGFPMEAEDRIDYNLRDLGIDDLLASVMSNLNHISRKP